MPNPDELEAEADQKDRGADADRDTAEMLRRQAEEQRANEARERDAHEG
jgi:hypothetical protein